MLHTGGDFCLQSDRLRPVRFGRGNNGGSVGTGAGTVYTIQYTDDAGTHTIEVKDGDLYSLEAIPQREGYTFLWLFAAETGGTQYVTANGSALSAFTDEQNLVLYPQFCANEYTLVLDYGGAPATGERHMTVTYGQSLPELPKNLTLEHSEFAGWYTQQDCWGMQVADAYGPIPVVSVVNSDNFDLSGQYLYLYAGFAPEMFAVTFHFGGQRHPQLARRGVRHGV